MFNKPFRVVAGSTLSGYWNGLNTEKGNMVHFTTIFRINKIFHNKGLYPSFCYHLHYTLFLHRPNKTGIH
jgi:hypothetical protein